MADDRNGSAPLPDASGERSRRSKRMKEPDSDSDESGSQPERRRRRSRKDRRRSPSSSSESESESDTESGSDSEEERRRRKRRRRREREEEREKRRRRKEKDKKRRRGEKDKKRKEKKEKGKKGAVTNSWGKYGVIRETDMWNKRPEFTAWLAEIKQVNLECLPNWEEKQLFKEFMEDHNTATFPSKKYYGLDAYHQRMMEKELKRGYKKPPVLAERTEFNDEEQRRQELIKEREKQKEEQVKALKRAMPSEMAQAMKEQAQLREEMAYQYKIGNYEAAAAIQRRLDPDAPPG